MLIAARWIRLEPNGSAAWRAAVAGFAQAQSARSAPAVLWTRSTEEGFVFALVAPLRLAPGRARRWGSWALAPLIAAYRLFGLRAYLDGGCVSLSGRRIAQAEASTVGNCAVVAARVLSRFPGLPADATERSLVDAFRCRIEAQHGWQFDHSWPSSAERAAIGEAIAAEVLDAK